MLRRGKSARPGSCEPDERRVVWRCQGWAPAADLGERDDRACHRPYLAAPRPGRLPPGHSRQADLSGRQGPAARHPPRLVLRAGPRRARSPRRRLDDHHPHRLRRRPQAGLLSQPGIPDRPPARRLLAQSRPLRDGRGGHGCARRRCRGGAQGRAGRCPGQWRPGPARRLPARQHGDTGHRCLRLRHPLRARPVQAGARRRLAGRAAGGLARLRQSLGVRARRIRSTRSASTAMSARSATPRAGASGSGKAASASWPWPTTRRWSAGAGGTSTRCACGRRRAAT